MNGPVLALPASLFRQQAESFGMPQPDAAAETLCERYAYLLRVHTLHTGQLVVHKRYFSSLKESYRDQPMIVVDVDVRSYPRPAPDMVCWAGRADIVLAYQDEKGEVSLIFADRRFLEPWPRRAPEPAA